MDDDPRGSWAANLDGVGERWVIRRHETLSQKNITPLDGQRGQQATGANTTMCTPAAAWRTSSAPSWYCP